MSFWKKAASEPAKWLVAGLGNPGRQYESTRHNVGFHAIDVLAGKLDIKIKKLKFHGLYGERAGIVLLKPQTYMNKSGISVSQAARFYKLPPERIIAVYDDISLAPGRLRVRPSGSDGGHNGIKDILYHLHSDAFPRIKIGVGGKPHPDMNLADHVLSGFSGAEEKLVAEAVAAAAEAALCIIDEGVQKAMNDFNGARD